MFGIVCACNKIKCQTMKCAKDNSAQTPEETFRNECANGGGSGASLPSSGGSLAVRRSLDWVFDFV